MYQDPNHPMGRRYNLLCNPPANTVIIELPVLGKFEFNDYDVKIEIHTLLTSINCK